MRHHKLPDHMPVESMLKRAARTFLQTFLAVLLATPVLDLSGPGLKAAATAGLASVLSLVHRLLDESRIPTLADEPHALRAGRRSGLPEPRDGALPRAGVLE